MTRILAFHGSARRGANSSLLLREVLDAAREGGAAVEEIFAHRLDLKPCRGCLRCNSARRCSQTGDAWDALSGRIEAADVLAFASPVFFHHLTAPLKMLLERFRCFFHVQITETGLIHTPWREWSKRWVLIQSHGSPDEADAGPVRDLFAELAGFMGPDNRLDVLLGNRLAVPRQVLMEADQLRRLYGMLEIPERLAAADHRRNRELLAACRALGRDLAKSAA
ncbi:MAG: flavodoxin family protein [Candidatus Krumholzibacteriota bacterium]|nr:flavodoxin family protein [Candidatus Krumholzibacteriota bacterium]